MKNKNGAMKYLSPNDIAIIMARMSDGDKSQEYKTFDYEIKLVRECTEPL
jgi:hypothetical protein